jgi:hypothetical protein
MIGSDHMQSVGATNGREAVREKKMTLGHVVLTRHLRAPRMANVSSSDVPSWL